MCFILIARFLHIESVMTELVVLHDKVHMVHIGVHLHVLCSATVGSLLLQDFCSHMLFAHSSFLTHTFRYVTEAGRGTFFGTFEVTGENSWPLLFI
jgi:hypothetical protein